MDRDAAERVMALIRDAEKGHGIVLFPGHRVYYTVETGLLRLALTQGEEMTQQATIDNFNPNDPEDCEACLERRDQCPYHRGFDAGVAAAAERITS